MIVKQIHYVLNILTQEKLMKMNEKIENWREKQSDYKRGVQKINNDLPIKKIIKLVEDRIRLNDTVLESDDNVNACLIINQRGMQRRLVFPQPINEKMAANVVLEIMTRISCPETKTIVVTRPYSIELFEVSSLDAYSSDPSIRLSFTNPICKDSENVVDLNSSRIRTIEDLRTIVSEISFKIFLEISKNRWHPLTLQLLGLSDELKIGGLRIKLID